jgi:hypothetical protein
VKLRIAEEGLPFRVDETCVIGFFDFGNYRLWRDLSDNWQHYMKNPLINHMVTKQNQSYPPQSDAEVVRIDLDELASELPIPADSSQLDAIRRALAKQTYVLQGPPGTGKSSFAYRIAMTLGRHIISLDLLALNNKNSIFEAMRSPEIDEESMMPKDVVFIFDEFDRTIFALAERQEKRKKMDNMFSNLLRMIKLQEKSLHFLILKSSNPTTTF